MTDLKTLFEKNYTQFQNRHKILGVFSPNALWDLLTSGAIKALTEGIDKGEWKYKNKYLHSPRNAVREAERNSTEYENAQALIALSLGAGYLLLALKPTVKNILLIENNPYVFVAFILSGLFEKYTGEITLFYNNLERDDALEAILPWLQGKNLKRTFIYYHAPLWELDKQRMTRAYERVKQLFEKRSVNQATIIKFQQLWNKNIFLNRKGIINSRTLHSLWENKPPHTIIIAGAGPSLSESIAALQKFRDRYILFAADTAFIPLAKADIFADAVFSADPQWINHYFSQSSLAQRALWAMDPVVCPAIVRYVQSVGAQTLFWNNVFLADTHYRTIDRGDVAHGGSVSTNAFDAARAWLYRRSENENRARLILIGQDLSFSNRQAHVKGAVLEAHIFARNNRLHGFERHNLRQMTAMPTLWRKGIRSAKVRTNGKLAMFIDWFEMQAADTDTKRVQLINATHDGAYLKGFEHTTLADALKDADRVSPIQISKQKIVSLKPLGILDAHLKKIYRLMTENTSLALKVNPTRAEIDCLNKND
ncbi:MAG TPA: DUF115 domain-containing protein, partial [Turneriella sp.]|nr:DUF115 domain-containing protein [Turneriella sp.]